MPYISEYYLRSLTLFPYIECTCKFMDMTLSKITMNKAAVQRLRECGYRYVICVYYVTYKSKYISRYHI